MPVFRRSKSTRDGKMRSDQQHGPGRSQGNYLRYIGAGAVAAGGIISMLRALPLIFSSILSGMRDLRASRVARPRGTVRTERDLSMSVVLVGSLGMVAGPDVRSLAGAGLVRARAFLARC